MGTSPEPSGPLKRVLGGAALLWFIRAAADKDLDAEHPEVFYFSTKRIDELRDIAVQAAAEIPDDAEAVAAIRAAGGKPKQWKRAAAVIRGDGYAREHRNYLRAARLLKAAAEGGTPVPPSREEEALFRAVDGLEALPPDEAFAALASEVPALRALEREVASRSEPGWADRDADDRVHEIVEELEQLVGPRAPAGSPLIRSHTAFGHARIHLLGQAGLLVDDSEDEPDASAADPGDGQSEEPDLVALLARGYKVRADGFVLAKAISKRVVDRPSYEERTATYYVLAYLLEPGIVTKLRRGDGPSRLPLKVMTKMVEACKTRLPTAEFIEIVLKEVRSTLLRVSERTEGK